MAMYNRRYDGTNPGLPITSMATPFPGSSASEESDNGNGDESTTNLHSQHRTKKRRRTGKRRRKSNKSMSGTSGISRPHTATGSGRRSARPGSRAKKLSGRHSGYDEESQRVIFQDDQDSPSKAENGTSSTSVTPVNLYASLSKRNLLQRVNAATRPSSTIPYGSSYSSRKTTDNLIMPSYRATSVEPANIEQYGLTTGETFQQRKHEQRPHSRAGTVPQSTPIQDSSKRISTGYSQYRINNDQSNGQIQIGKYRINNGQANVQTSMSQHQTHNDQNNGQSQERHSRVTNGHSNVQTRASYYRTNTDQSNVQKETTQSSTDQRQGGLYRNSYIPQTNGAIQTSQYKPNAGQDSDQNETNQYRLASSQSNSSPAEKTSTLNRASLPNYSRPFSSSYKRTTILSLTSAGDKSEVPKPSSATSGSGSQQVPLKYSTSSSRNNLISAKAPVASTFVRPSQKTPEPSSHGQPSSEEGSSKSEERKPISLRTYTPNSLNAGVKNDRCYPVVTPGLLQESRTGVPPHHEPLLTRAKTWSWTSVNGSLNELGTSKAKVSPQKGDGTEGDQKDNGPKSILKMRDHCSRESKKQVRFTMPEDEDL